MMKNNNKHRLTRNFHSLFWICLIAFLPITETVPQAQLVQEGCGSDKKMTGKHYGIKGTSTTLSIFELNNYPNTEKVIIEATCRNYQTGDCPDVIKYQFEENGIIQQVTIPRVAIDDEIGSGPNSESYVYRYTYNGTPDEVRYIPYQSYNSMRGLTVWIIEGNATSPNIPNVITVDKFFYKNPNWVCTNVSIPLSLGSRDATILIPSYEYSNDGRWGRYKATAYVNGLPNVTTGTQSLNGNNNGLGNPNEVRLDQLALNNVPANASIIQVCFQSYEQSPSPGPSSFIIGSIGVTFDDCALCDLTAEVETTAPTCSPNTDEYGTPDSPQTAPTTDGTATATPNGGTPPYTYAWSDGQTTQTATDLASGTYGVTITDLYDCVTTGSGLVGTIPPLYFEILSSTAATCYAAADATVTVAYDGGNGASYALFVNGIMFVEQLNNAGIYVLNGVPAGTNEIALSDNSSCLIYETVTINEPDSIIVQIQTSAPTCPENAEGYYSTDTPAPTSDGDAVSIVSGGTAPYTYEWSNGSTQSTTDGLSSGTVSLTVSDANGCIAVVSGVVDTIPPLEAFFSIEEVSCAGGSDGSITLQYGGGNDAGYILHLDGAVIPGVFNGGTYVFENLSAGEYEVIVCDVNGCILVTVICLQEADTLMAAATATDESCGNGGDGGVDLTVSGGTLPYTYLWDTGAITEDLENVSAGIYSVSVTDGNDCTVIVTAEVGVSTEFNLDEIVYQPPCAGDNGNIDLLTPGGTQPYDIIWSNGATTEDLINVPPGIYSVTATNSEGCVATETYELVEPDSINITFNIDSLSNGQYEITGTVTGGTAPYSYNWTPASNGTSIIVGLDECFSLKIADDNGCTAILEGCAPDSLYGVIDTIFGGLDTIFTGIYPNPVFGGGKAYIKKTGKSVEDVQIELTTIEGKVIKQFSVAAWDGNVIELDVSNQTPGTYLIIISSKKAVITRKLIIHGKFP